MILSVLKQGHKTFDVIIVNGDADLIHIIFHKESRLELLHIPEPVFIRPPHLPVRSINPCGSS